MNHQFDLKVRWYAILFNLIILSGQPAIVGSLVYLLERYQSGRDLNVFFLFLWFLPPIWFLSLTILSVAIWILLLLIRKTTQQQHQLIDILSKEFVNFLLSISLVLLGIDTTLVIGYWLKGGDATYPYLIGIFLNLIVLISTFSIVVYAIIQIARRRVHHYPCIVRVLN
jgi:uncharacterized Tic20 family protein